MKIGGERAYKLMRRGEEVEMPVRRTTVHELGLVAVGLYEVSRLREQGQAPSWPGVFRAIWAQGGKEISWMAFVTIFLFQFVAIWNNFFLPLVLLTDPKLFPVSLGLFQWSTRQTQFPQYTPLVITGSRDLLTPPRLGTNSIAAGTWCASTMASWPAPECQTRCCG